MTASVRDQGGTETDRGHTSYKLTGFVCLVVFWSAVAVWSQHPNIWNPTSLVQANRPWYASWLVALFVFVTTAAIAAGGGLAVSAGSRSRVAIFLGISVSAVAWILFLASVTTF